jgi:hypothetical protein
MVTCLDEIDIDIRIEEKRRSLEQKRFITITDFKTLMALDMLWHQENLSKELGFSVNEYEATVNWEKNCRDKFFNYWAHRITV